MKKTLLLSVFLVIGANAALPEKIAASYAAKYEVCALKLKDTNNYKLKALGLKIKADEIHRDKLFKEGYLKAYKKEKKSAWLLSLEKCKKLANKI